MAGEQEVAHHAGPAPCQQHHHQQNAQRHAPDAQPLQGSRDRRSARHFAAAILIRVMIGFDIAVMIRIGGELGVVIDIDVMIDIEIVIHVAEGDAASGVHAQVKKGESEGRHEDEVPPRK